jgi:hypothetical protein
MSTTRCSIVNGNLVDPCDMLSSVTQNENPKGRQRGVYCWELFRPGADGPTRRMYGAKSGEYIDGGLLFNFCPFCGADLRASQKPREN